MFLSCPLFFGARGKKKKCDNAIFISTPGKHYDYMFFFLSWISLFSFSHIEFLTLLFLAMRNDELSRLAMALTCFYFVQRMKLAES